MEAADQILSVLNTFTRRQQAGCRAAESWAVVEIRSGDCVPVVSGHLRQWPVVPAIVTMPAPATAVTLALVLARCSAATRWSHHIITVGNCSLCCRGEVDPEQWENSVYHHKYSHQHHNAQLQQGDKGEDRVDLQPVVDFFLEFE